jgi:tRNA(Ile)-lysidine synthase
MHRFETAVAAAWPPQAWQDVTVLVAVSGGADSVALLRACATAKRSGSGRLGVVHFNHGLRGPESDSDARFVAALSQQLGLPFEVGEPERGPSRRARGEAAARRDRYRFFDQAAQRWGARYVVTAHTRDDQVETVLYNIIRGTGLAGLAGIPPRRRLSEVATLVRPLLALSRQDVLTYLGDLGQEYREDATNQQLHFKRNKLRHELLPLLASQYNPSIRQSLWRLAHLAAEAQEVIQHKVDRVLASCRRAGGDHDWVELDCDQLSGHPAYVVREVLARVWRQQGWPMQAMGFDEWSRLERMLSRDEATENLPGNILARKSKSVLRLSFWLRSSD